MGKQKTYILVGLALGVGVILWVFYLTDYTFAGTLVDYLFPPLSFVVGVFGFAATRQVPRGTGRRLARLATLPALLGGFLSLAAGILFVVLSPFGTMAELPEMMGEQIIQTAPSPDGSRIAEVYFRRVGSSYNGHVSVRVKHRLLPLMERDVYQIRFSYGAGRGKTNQMSWRDNDTIYISETGEVVQLGLVRTKIPELAAETAAIFQFVSRIATYRVKERILTSPLKDLPLYPGLVTNDNSGADTLADNGYRAFSVAAPNSDEAASWYGQELSKAPWSVKQASRRVRDEHFGAELQLVHQVYNCFETERDTGTGQSSQYYWQIFSNEAVRHVRVIVETPNKPIVWHCDESSNPWLLAGGRTPI
jgi:hypothetical protein